MTAALLNSFTVMFRLSQQLVMVRERLLIRGLTVTSDTMGLFRFDKNHYLSLTPNRSAFVAQNTDGPLDANSGLWCDSLVLCTLTVQPQPPRRDPVAVNKCSTFRVPFELQINQCNLTCNLSTLTAGLTPVGLRLVNNESVSETGKAISAFS